MCLDAHLDESHKLFPGCLAFQHRFHFRCAWCIHQPKEHMKVRCSSSLCLNHSNVALHFSKYALFPVYPSIGFLGNAKQNFQNTIHNKMKVLCKRKGILGYIGGSLGAGWSIHVTEFVKIYLHSCENLGYWVLRIWWIYRYPE